METHYVKQKPSSRTLAVYRFRDFLLMKDSLRVNFFNNNRTDLSKDLTQVNLAETASFLIGGNM